jgi:PAS domain S-box-containing protein
MLNSGEKQKFSLVSLLQYGLLSLVTSSSLLLGTILIHLSWQKQLTISRSLQTVQSELVAQAIDNYTEDLVRPLNYLAKVPGLTDLPLATQQSLLVGITRQNDTYELAGLINSQGQVLTTASRYGQTIEKNQINSNFFRTAFYSQEQYIGSVEIDPETNLPIVTIALPVRNQADQVAGVLFAKLNLEFLSNVLSVTEMNNNAHIYVIDEKLRVIAHQGKEVRNNQLQDASHIFKTKDLVRLITPKAKYTGKYQGLQNEKVFGAIAPVSAFPWKVIVELPSRELYQPLYRMLWLMAGILLLLTLSTLLLSWFFAKKLNSPLLKLTKAAQSIRNGNLDAQVEVPYLQELAVLAQTFNQMTAHVKELVEAVEKERNFVTQILNSAGALIVVLDAQGKICQFNQTCERLTGYSLEEVKGIFFGDILLNSPDKLETLEFFQELINSDLAEENFIREHENYIFTKTGEKRLIDWSNTLLFNSQGEVNYIISIGIDVTEQKQAAELRQAKETAEATLKQLQKTQAQLLHSEKMASLGQLVAGIAHEINNPNNFISGNLNHLADYVNDLLAVLNLYETTYPQTTAEISEKLADVDWEFLQEDLPKVISSMQSGVERIKQIVLSLRTFSRLDEVGEKKVDIHTGIDSALMLLNSRLKLPNVRPDIQVIKNYGDLPKVECYSGELNQVFINILSNAIDALDSCYDTGRRGHSQKSCDVLNIPQITITTTVNAISTADSQPTVSIHFQDNGPGIPAENMKRLFDPFFTTKPVGQGTGLGLSISYEIVVERHKGKLLCQSQPGEGVSFIVEIPVKMAK